VVKLLWPGEGGGGIGGTSPADRGNCRLALAIKRLALNVIGWPWFFKLTYLGCLSYLYIFNAS